MHTYNLRRLGVEIIFGLLLISWGNAHGQVYPKASLHSVARLSNPYENDLYLKSNSKALYDSVFKSEDEDTLASQECDALFTARNPLLVRDYGRELFQLKEATCSVGGIGGLPGRGGDYRSDGWFLADTVIKSEDSAASFALFERALATSRPLTKYYAIIGLMKLGAVDSSIISTLPDLPMRFLFGCNFGLSSLRRALRFDYSIEFLWGNSLVLKRKK